MALGSQTVVVNGQRFVQPTDQQWDPQGYGPQTTGVPQIGPTMPPFLSGTSAGSSGSYGMEGVGGYGTAGNNALVAATANANPHNWKVSPVWWAILFLVGGILLINGIHWRKVVNEGVEEHAHVGAVSERGEESG